MNCGTKIGPAGSCHVCDGWAAPAAAADKGVRNGTPVSTGPPFLAVHEIGDRSREGSKVAASAW
jgi:hypothetical protein